MTEYLTEALPGGTADSFRGIPALWQEESSKAEEFMAWQPGRTKKETRCGQGKVQSQGVYFQTSSESEKIWHFSKVQIQNI